MDLKLHDILIMKKPHPCGCKEFELLRLGVDYKLKCTKCGREVMVLALRHISEPTRHLRISYAVF
ncbi:MAG: DUF951 domain-containing protein, partial [Eubacterium sp.]|nr:DUF951 domain-containing protein [Eubacterium sp.]